MKPTASPSGQTRPPATTRAQPSSVNEAVARRRAQLAQLKQGSSTRPSDRLLQSTASSRASVAPPTNPVSPRRRLDFAESSPEAQRSPPLPATTPGNAPRKLHAGHTPHPNAGISPPTQPTTLHAGRTPHPNASKVSPPVTTTATASTAGRTPYPKTNGSTPPSLVAEAGRTPHPTKARSLVSSVALTASETPELRYQKAMERLVHEKEDLLKQVLQLETEKSNQHHWQGLQAIVQMADAEGEAAAVQWAREQEKHRPNSTPTRTTRRSPSKRVATPYPKREDVNKDEDIEYYKQAVEQAVFLFESEGVEYTIRRPYGYATERDLWMAAGHLLSKGYRNTADPALAETLEIVAMIAADESQLVLYGTDSVRHYVDKEWKEYGPVVDDEDLGMVSYIDENANENKYNLADVFWGARAAREHYSMAVISLVDALKAGTFTSLQKETAPPSAITKVSSKDAGIMTDEVKEPEKKEAPKRKKKSAPPPPPPPEESGVMVTFIGMLFQFVFGLLYTLFVRIPLQIVVTSIVFVGAYFVATILWMYASDGVPPALSMRSHGGVM